VRLFFSEPVEPAAGIKVVRGGGQSVQAGKPFVPAANRREIVIPLQKGLGAGPYSVQWSEIDQEDGHLISGAFIFAVRSGLPPLANAAPAASGGTGPPAHAVVSRWLLLAGILVAAGVAGYGLLVSRPLLSAEAPGLLARQDRADAFMIAGALALATLGAVLTVVLEPGSTGTRFGQRTIVGACIAAAGAAAALGSVRVRALRLPAAAIAVLLLVLPTATGHASAAGVPHGISIPADLAHLASAAFWLGGVLELAVIAPFVVSRADRESRRTLRRALARRFTPFAAGAVVLLGISGVLRAVNELDSVRQLWTTGYGQALLVKTGLLCGLLVLGWLNRNRLRRAEIGAELALLAGVVAAVAVLTNVQPGIARGPAVAAATAASRTVVFAGQDDNLAVGVALSPHGDHAVDLRATVLGFQGPVSGLDIGLGVDGKRASSAPCGKGCYRATVPVSGSPRTITARIAGRGRPAATLRFAAPEQWPAQPADDIVRRAEETIDSLKTLVVHSRLGSDSHHEVKTTYRMVAPDRLAYHNVGGGDSIIIGNRRWDRQPGKGWVQSQQIPSLSQPAPFWPSGTTDAHVLRTAKVDGRPVWVVSFLDPSTPSWFTAWVDRSTYRTLRLDMVATAHFMHDRAGPFDAPVEVEPPGS
jgi:putative copper export protein